MRRGGFRGEPRAIAELKRSAGYRKLRREAAADVARVAGTLMPRGDDKRRGHIADKFDVYEDADTVAVGNSDPLFHLAEFGSAKNPAYAPLRRAVRAVGLVLRDKRDA